MVRFDEAVLVTGGLSLGLMVGENAVNATYVSGAGTDQLTFSYTVAGEDSYTNIEQFSYISGAVSIAMPEGQVVLRGEGSIHDAAGNVAALGYEGEDQSGFTVDNTPLNLTLSAGHVFGSTQTAANAIVGFVYPTGTEPNDENNMSPVSMADLDGNGDYIVPDGMAFIDVDQYSRYFFNNSPPPGVEGVVHVELADRLVVNLFGPGPGSPVFAMSEESIRFFAAYIDSNDTGYFDYVIANAIPASDLAYYDGTNAGEVLGDDFLAEIVGHDPANIELHLSSPLTLPQVQALREAGFDLNNVYYTLRDDAATLQAANASPAEREAMYQADEVILVGNELDNSIVLSGFEKWVATRVEAGNGNDTLQGGRADDVIVGQLGADQITLTTKDTSADTIVYQTRFDGGSLPVTTVHMPVDTTGEDASNYYREGSKLSVEINGIASDYTMTGEDTAQEALQSLAHEIMREHLAVDPSQVVAGFLISKSLLSVFSNGTFNIADGLLNALSKPVMLSQFDENGEFKVPAGFVLLPPVFGDPIAQAGETYSLTDEHIIETAFLTVNSAPSILANAGFVYALGADTNTGISVLWNTPELIAANVQPDNTINLVGADHSTVIDLHNGSGGSGYGNFDYVNVSNPGGHDQSTATFSSTDADYVSDGTLSIKINHGTDEITVSADMVAGSATQSVAALLAAVNTAAAVNGTLHGIVSSAVTSGVYGLTLTSAEIGADKFDVADAYTTLPVAAITQVSEIDFSGTTDDDFIGRTGNAAGKVSVTIGGLVITADEAETKAETIANLKAAIELAITPVEGEQPTAVSIATYTLTDVLNATKDFVVLSSLGGITFGRGGSFTVGDAISFIDNYVPSIRLSLDAQGHIVIEGASTNLVGADKYITFFDRVGDVVSNTVTDYGTDSFTGLSEVLASVTQTGDSLILTAKNAGLDPLTVSELSYSTPDLTPTDGLAASHAQVVVMNMSNSALDALVTGDTVAVTIDGVTATVTIGDGTGGTLLLNGPAQDHSTQVMEALRVKLVDNLGPNDDVSSVDIGDWSKGVFTAGNSGYDTTLQFTAKVIGDHAYAADAMGEVGTAEVGFTITHESTALANPGSSELVQQGVLVWAAEPTDNGLVINDANTEGKAVTGADATTTPGEQGGYAETVTGFDSFDIDGYADTVTVGSLHDQVWNFQTVYDHVDFESGLWRSMQSGDADVVDGIAVSNVGRSLAPTLDLSYTEFGMLSSGSSSLRASDLTDVQKVVDRLDTAFSFTAGDNQNLNATVFAITASNDSSQTALWVHQQSSVDDHTVSVDEMTLLAVLHTTGGQFEAHNFTAHPYYAND